MSSRASVHEIAGNPKAAHEDTRTLSILCPRIPAYSRVANYFMKLTARRGLGACAKAIDLALKCMI